MQNYVRHLSIRDTEWFNQRLILTFFIVAVLFFLPDIVYAQQALPTGGNVVIPGTSDSDSWVKKFSFVIKLGVFILCMAAVGFGISDSIFSIFRTINDARQTGEWGPAMKQMLIIILGIVMAVVLFAVLNELVMGAIDKFFA